ncbi:MAG: membrane-bound lytic murein transglycosylase MltF [Gallionellaceae bacterium]|nr:membrane-bound lytic murein transglycosylase MltF [Gallionellaceae bacterium]
MRNLIRCLRTVLVGSSLLLAACSQQLPDWRDGKLVAVVPEIAQGAEAEFERELVTLFGQHLHAATVLIPKAPEEVGQTLNEHHAHLAAASLRSDSNVAALSFSTSYQTVREQIICNSDNKLPKTLADLAGKKLTVVAGSAQEAALREAQVKLPSLQFQVRNKIAIKELLQEVSEGISDCTAANELQFFNARNYYPNLGAALNIGSPSKLAWAFPRDADPALFNEAQAFFERIRHDGTLHRLLDRFYGHSDRLAPADSSLFISRIAVALPHYRHFFEEAAKIVNEDWRLLAAIAYQESQWDPLATSFTNVRGMMMLTEETADRMGVENRLNARESIIAGAKYLALLKEQMPDRILEPDRTWMALAAYNQGYGHLEDARILTQRAGQNPDRWLDVKKWMPLLNQPGYYEKLKHGYARGGEAVILVESIRSYYDILKQLRPEQKPAVEDDDPYQSFSLL